jgi:glucokinase
MSEQPFDGVGPEIIERQVLNFSHKLLTHPDVQNRIVIGFGVSTPGEVQADGVIKESFNLRLKNFPLQEILSNEFKVPVFIEVDTAAAAQAERYYGAGQGLDDFVYILVSNGIGSSIFIDGQLYQRKADFAGKMGHFIVDKTGPICVCGKRGCLETVAAGPAILSCIRHLLEFGKGDAIITEMIGNNPQELTLKVAAEAALRGSPLAKEAFENSADHLAIGILIMATILDISTFIIGGEIPQCAKEFYFKDLQHFIVKYRHLDSSYDNIKIHPALLESESFLKGISMLTLQDILDIQYIEER